MENSAAMTISYWEMAGRLSRIWDALAKLISRSGYGIRPGYSLGMKDHGLANTNQAFSLMYLLELYTIHTEPMTIATAVATAAPRPPYLGISRMFRVTLTTAETRTL